MSQDIYSNINPAVTSGTQLATLLNGFKDAVASGMSGTSRPSNLQAGGGWIDITNAGNPNFYWAYKVYDGTSDIEVFRVNLATSKASISGADSTFEIARISADSVGPIAKLVKQRIASNGQVLSGDIVGQVQVVGRTDTSTNPVVANLKVVATENETSSASGVYIAIEQTKSTTTTAVEVARLLDGKFGIGTSAPDVALHVKSTTGVKSEQSVDDANAALLLLEKSRVSGSGAVQSSDLLGEVRSRAKDSSGAVSDVAKIKVSATEGHTSSAKGTRMVIQTIDATTSSLADKITIDEKVEITPALKQNASELVAQSVATTASITQLSATKAIVEFTGSTATSLKGINSGEASKVILLHNRSTADVKLEHEDTGATAADRLKLPNNTFVTLRAQSSIEVYYCVADSRWKLKSGSGTGSSSGGGGSKNYLGTVNNINGNGDFELSATTGWSLGVTGTLSNGLPTTTPTFGSGASGNLSISAVTSGQLAGTASLSYASSAATTAGNMLASDAFTIDIADQAKVMTVKFSYKAVTNPTNANWSGTSSNSFAWAIYDVTNSAWIIPAGAFGMTQSLGVGVCTGTFQTSSNGTQYRLVVYNANATSGAITVYFDDFSVGPQTVQIGSFTSDWADAGLTTADFTGFGTVTGIAVESRRNGDTLEMRGRFITGTSTAVEARVAYRLRGTLLTAADTTKIPAIKSSGVWNFGSTSSAVPTNAAVLIEPSVSYFTVGFRDGTLSSLTKRTGTDLSASGQATTFFMSVPIAGWSSSTQLSNDTDTRIVSFGGTQVTQAVTANVTNIAFTTAKDSHGAWDGTQYTVPVSGDYVVAGSIVGPSGVTITAYVNGSAVLGANWSTTPAATTLSAGAPLLTNLKAGDLVSIRSNASVTLTSGGLQIYRLSGPSVIASTESVNASYTNTAGTAIGTGNTDVPFATKVYDSHNAFVSPTYTVPATGKYKVTVNFFTAAVTLTTSQSVNVQVVQAGSASVTNRVGRANGTGASNAYSTNGSTTLNCLAGDTIKVQANSGVATTMETTAGCNLIYIERIGN